MKMYNKFSLLIESVVFMYGWFWILLMENVGGLFFNFDGDGGGVWFSSFFVRLIDLDDFKVGLW